MNYLAARGEEKQVELYAMDLLWKLTTKFFVLESPMPSEIWNNMKRVDRRSGTQIVNDLLKGLGGK